MKNKLILSLLFGSMLLTLPACEYISQFRQQEKEENGRILAKVNRAYLYQVDVPKSIFGSAGKDSSQIVKKYVNDWVYQQLMIQKAKDFLPKESQRDIGRKVKEYEASLFAFEYEKELINQKVNYEVTEDEVSNYYNQNSSSLTLAQNVVKGRYFFMDTNNPQADSIKQWFKKTTESNILKLEDAGFQYASNFSLKAEWLPLEQFQVKLPVKLDRPQSFLKKDKFAEIGDSLRTCLVYIEDFRSKGQVAPLAYKEQDIRKIIVNKRRQEYLQRIKKSIFNEAKNSNNVEFY